ncbi:uncharacterized protein LOC143850061 [Tasmannia lanceolata]|uniref:uncharacterized protein LOC143850061 n=1 Tax=Tasmannia lanceolata TaxID=3420 RepID=UPI0040634270
MDEANSQERDHEKLDLDAPLLSTRRLGCFAHVDEKHQTDMKIGAKSNTSINVPFVWETVPGMPKVMELGCCRAGELSPPKLPPGRCHELQDYGDKNTKNPNNDDDNDDDVFSDAMDMTSLSESLGVSMSGVSGLDGLDLEGLNSVGSLSPSFIINRFLPAANALASSSSSSSFLPPSKNPIKRVPPDRHRPQKKPRVSGPQSVETRHSVECVSYSPPKACGLEFFLPWRLKNMHCGFKSPIQSCSTSTVKLKSHIQQANVASTLGPWRRRDKHHDVKREWRNA